MGETEQKATITYFEVMSGLFLFLILMLVLLTAIVGNNSLFLVLMGFFPTILVIIISLLSFENYVEKRKSLWFIPIAVIGLFYFIGKASPSVVGGLDVDILSSINFILSMIYTLTSFSVFRNYKKYSSVTKNNKTKVLKKGDLQDYVASIEDKSKALNFAIGRVYSQFHGGSESIRNKIRIPKDWYNDFSIIGIGTNSLDYKKLNEIIAKFEIHLRLFEKSEKDVFGSSIQNLKNLIRDVAGRDKIIDVLDHNDKDPVRSYYEGAVEFCEKVREEMRNHELKIVKNTYIPKNEDEREEIKKLQKQVSNNKKYFPLIEKSSSSSKKKVNSNSKSGDRKPEFNHP